MSKAERIKRKLARIEQLAGEALAIAETIPRESRVSEERQIAGAALDRARASLREWEQLEDRWRRDAESIARHQRALEVFGRCSRCDTGAAADHLHCEACGWAMDSFGPWRGRCSNRDCERFDRQQVGVRYSDKREVDDGAQAA